MALRDEKGCFLIGTEPGPGRTTSYDPAMDDQARKLALLGMTDKEIAKFFEVTPETIFRWKRDHIGFCHAINAGKVQADANVVDALYKRAVGMEIFEERLARKADGTQEAVQVRKQIPPDPGAAIQWLNIRQRGRWASKMEDRDPLPSEANDQRSPYYDKELQSLSDEELDARLAATKERIAVLEKRLAMKP